MHMILDLIFVNHQEEGIRATLMSLLSQLLQHHMKLEIFVYFQPCLLLSVQFKKHAFKCMKGLHVFENAALHAYI